MIEINITKNGTILGKTKGIILNYDTTRTDFFAEILESGKCRSLSKGQIVEIILKNGEYYVNEYYIKDFYKI